MFRSNIRLKEGAIFITDAHYNKPKGERALEKLLGSIAEKRIATPQLFLLGDIFDSLFGGVPYTFKENEAVIELIEKIANEKEVVYLEGNHDFRLQKFFTEKITVFSIAQQPVFIEGNRKKLCIAHGDFDAPVGYRLYTSLIRNPVILSLLNIYDSLTNHSILGFVERHMSKKEQCREFAWFEEFLEKRFERGCECDMFVEGHFHQNRTFSFNGCKYVNLGAFACNQRYFVVKFVNDEIRFEEQTLF